MCPHTTLPEGRDEIAGDGRLFTAAEAWNKSPVDLMKSGLIERSPSRIERCGAVEGGHLIVGCVAKTCILLGASMD